MRFIILWLALCLVFVVENCEAQTNRANQNLDDTRKDEYYMPRVGEPEYQIRLLIEGEDAWRAFKNQDGRAFSDIVRAFAKEHGIRKCRNKQYKVYHGPPQCSFKGNHVVIDSGIGAPDEIIDRLKIAPFDDGISTEDFRKLASSLVGELQKLFPDRVEVKVLNYLAPDKSSSTSTTNSSVTNRSQSK